jgi:hypothetical protein
MSTDQIASFGSAEVSAMRSDALAGWGATQVAALGTVTFAALGTACLAALTSDALSGITAAQLATRIGSDISAWGVDIHQLGAAAMAAFGTTRAGAHSLDVPSDRRQHSAHDQASHTEQTQSLVPTDNTAPSCPPASAPVASLSVYPAAAAMPLDASAVCAAVTPALPVGAVGITPVITQGTTGLDQHNRSMVHPRWRVMAVTQREWFTPREDAPRLPLRQKLAQGAAAIRPGR